MSSRKIQEYFAPGDPVAVSPEDQVPVWIACRASKNLLCEGREAIMVLKIPMQGGGVSTRYQCTTCKRLFHITC